MNWACWITGEPWSYENWKRDEPNNLGGEHFLHFMYYYDDFATKGATWNDARGIVDRVNGYVVEYDRHPFNTPPVADAGADQTSECETPVGARVVLDATFLRRWQRELFPDARIVYLDVSDETVKTRLAARSRDDQAISDADYAIYLEAKARFDPPAAPDWPGDGETVLDGIATLCA